MSRNSYPATAFAMQASPSSSILGPKHTAIGKKQTPTIIDTHNHLMPLFVRGGNRCIQGIVHPHVPWDSYGARSARQILWQVIHEHRWSVHLRSVPNGIRTRVAALKARCPRPTRRWGPSPKVPHFCIFAGRLQGSACSAVSFPY